MNKEYNCDVCDSGECVEIPGVKKFTGGQPIHVCRDCGLVYHRFRRSPEEMAKYWGSLYSENNTNSSKYNPDQPIFVARHVYGASFLENNVESGLSGKSVFDVGIGKGQFLEKLLTKGCFCSGIESSSQNIQILKHKGIPHYFGTVESYSQDKKVDKSDIVTILFVLQNSQSATAMINMAYDQLVEGGLLFIMMGSRIMVPFKKPVGTYLMTLPQDVQPYHFSISTLQHLLAKCGFKIVSTNNYWDQDLMCVLARKESKDNNIEKMKDDYREVIKWFERWQAESEKMQNYIRKVDGIEMAQSPAHTFYINWRG